MFGNSMILLITSFLKKASQHNWLVIDVMSELLGMKSCIFMFHVGKEKYRDQQEVIFRLSILFVNQNFAVKNKIKNKK